MFRKLLAAEIEAVRQSIDLVRDRLEERETMIAAREVLGREREPSVPGIWTLRRPV